MSELLIVVSIRAKPGTEAELCGDPAAVVEPSRKEPGCLRDGLFVEETGPRAFVFVEHWASREADRHLECEPRVAGFDARRGICVDRRGGNGRIGSVCQTADLVSVGKKSSTATTPIKEVS